MKYPSLKRAASLDPRTKSQTEDLQPWYRQFWPWFLIALPGCAVVASLYTLNLAMQTTDSLVVESNLGMDVVAAQHIKAAAYFLQADLAGICGLPPYAVFTHDRYTDEPIVCDHKYAIGILIDQDWRTAAVPASKFALGTSPTPCSTA